MSELKTKEDLLNKLRAYHDTPDDDVIRYKDEIKENLLKCPELLYALHSDSIEDELFDEDGNINWDGEWDRFYGANANIRPYLYIPDTQSDTQNYLCYQVSFNSIPKYNNIQKYTDVTFTIFVHKQDRDDKFTGLPRHDLIASIIRERFNWSSIFGFQTKLVSNKESVMDNNYLVRTLIFEILDTNGITYTPFNDDTYIRNDDYWQ